MEESEYETQLLARHTATHIALKALFASLDSEHAARLRLFLLRSTIAVEESKDADLPVNIALVEQLNIFNSLLDRK